MQKSDKTLTCMTTIKIYTTWIFDSSRSFHASFINLITNTSALCCFLHYATTLPTKLATCKHSFLGLANQAITYLLPQIAATSFSLWPFFLWIPEAFNSSKIPKSFAYMAMGYDHVPIQKAFQDFAYRVFWYESPSTLSILEIWSKSLACASSSLNFHRHDL